MALVYSFILVVAAATARAEQPPTIPLFVSNTIASDSAAARAATRLSTAVASDFQLKTQTLHAFHQHNSSQPGLVLAPLMQWSRIVPALDVLRLPFFFTDLPAIHQAIDGNLGKHLAQVSQSAGWTLLAVWDAGMTDFSGNQRYNRLPNLAGMQFVLWEHDQLQETELHALDVWTRVISHDGVQRNAQECLVNSRSTTPAQMWREHLQRVHLDITLTHDRYEGFALAVPNTLWHALSHQQRASLIKHLANITTWERRQAAQEQQQALTALHNAGMTLHTMDASQRKVFASRMPPWLHFLNNLDARMANNLLAAAGTTTATGSGDGSGEKALTDPLPASQTTK